MKEIKEAIQEICTRLDLKTRGARDAVTEIVTGTLNLNLSLTDPTKYEQVIELTVRLLQSFLKELLDISEDPVKYKDKLVKIQTQLQGVHEKI